MVEVSLIAAGKDEVQTIWEMTHWYNNDFTPADLIQAGKDFTLENVMERFEQPWTTYYFISNGNESVGVIRIVDKKDGSRKRISPIWIMPEHRNKGFAQAAIKAAEKKYGSNTGVWTLFYRKAEIFICTKKWAITEPER